MILDLKRVLMGENSTIGELYGPDGDFWCRTLEDPVRNVKIHGKTAIPAGVYELSIAFSLKYGRLMPRIWGVPFYTGILIHPGNSPVDTDGCILVGDDDPNTPDFLEYSRNAFDRIFPLIRKLCEKGETNIRITGGFEAKDFIRAVPGAVS